MRAGDKLVCVNDSRNKDFPEYASPLVAGKVYVVRDVIQTPSGKPGVVLVGVQLPETWPHQSFSLSRFRPLLEMKSEAYISNFAGMSAK